MEREEAIKRLSALVDALTEEKSEATGEERIEFFLAALNGIPLVKAERDDRRCQIEVSLKDDPLFTMDYAHIERMSDGERQWWYDCTVASSLRRYVYESRKETENEK